MLKKKERIPYFIGALVNGVIMDLEIFLVFRFRGLAGRVFAVRGFAVRGFAEHGFAVPRIRNFAFRGS